MSLNVRPGMFHYDDVIAFLLAACPSYETSPERAAVDDANGEYLRVTGFVRHLIRLLDEQDTDCFAEVFALIEWILTDAEREAVDLIETGFLDDLADSSLYEGTRVRPADFGRWFGPRARRIPAVRSILNDEAP